jgi:pyridoxal 5'-phosphate synthase pdxT subunit
MILGILALQGDVPEHRAALAGLLPAGSIVDVRDPASLARVDGLLLPGGESTTIANLLAETGLTGPLRDRLDRGLPVLATCAGLILLARELAGPSPGPAPTTLARLDVSVRRNDYGRQAASFEAPLRVPLLKGPPFPGVFIRAPRILRVGPTIEPVAYLGPEVVGVRHGPIWGLAFHPELASDPRLHAAWLASWTAPRGRRQRAASATATSTTSAATPTTTASQ